MIKGKPVSSVEFSEDEDKSMIRRRFRSLQHPGVSSAWVSFSDLFSQLMFIAIVACVLLGIEYATALEKISCYISQIKELQEIIDSLKKQLASAQTSKLSVSGTVIYPIDKPDSALAFQIQDTVFPVEPSGKFMLRDLDSGRYSAVLSGDGYKEKTFRFQISQGGFDGYDVYPGEVIDQDSIIVPELPEGLVIKEITEEYLKFQTAKFQITPEGKKFLSDQFSIQSKDGLTPLQRLSRDQGLKIVVVGQADPDRVDPGVGYTNIGLSTLRASAVADYITDELGFQKDQVIVMGLGAADAWLPERPPEALFSKKEYYSKCRRVLIMYSENSEETLLNKIRNLGNAQH